MRHGWVMDVSWMCHGCVHDLVDEARAVVVDLEHDLYDVRVWMWMWTSMSMTAAAVTYGRG